jgi:hypothetical protein
VKPFLPIKKIFLILFILFFIFIKAIDNENICGEIGESESHCFFSQLGEDESEHICVQCPCNGMVLWVSPLQLKFSLQFFPVEILNKRYEKIYSNPELKSLFRPPRFS